jgi:hypothetical protein
MRVIKISLLIFLSLILTSCDLAFGYRPPVIPLSISIDTRGQVTFSVEQEVKLPTPIGTFSVGVIMDPAVYFGVQNTLTVRYNGEDHIYDLHGQDFTITFASGYYKKVAVSKRGSNLLLELKQKNGNNPSTDAPDNPNNSSEPQVVRKMCTGAPPIRVEIGDIAYVTSNCAYPIYMRIDPVVGTNVKQYLKQSDELRVIDGPRCSNDVSFFLVEAPKYGKTGWVAEAEPDSNNYCIELK